MSPPPLGVISYALGDVGKSGDRVIPVTYAFPAPSAAIATPTSPSLPPRNVLNLSRPEVASNFITNASPHSGLFAQSPPPPKVRLRTPGVVGKLLELVIPVTEMAPFRSHATSPAWSIPSPPKYVAKRSDEPVASSFATNPSSPPL